MNIYTYKVIPEVALDFYRENGMELKFDSQVLNGLLVVQATDEDTADKIRMTFTDIRMWKRVDE
jgi:hypothetical protein